MNNDDLEKIKKLKDETPEALNGVFKGLASFVDSLGDLAEKGKELRESGDFEVDQKQARYGVSMNFGLPGHDRESSGAGSPSVQPINKSRQKKEEDADVHEPTTREPHLDVFDEGDRLLVIIELPGVADSAYSLSCSDNQLKLVAKGQQVIFDTNIDLPVACNLEQATQSMQHGVLEISLPKADS